MWGRTNMKTRKLKMEAIDNEDRDPGVAWDAFNEPKPQHTPTPLEIDLYQDGSKYPATFLVERLGISTARSHEIVRAVNAYEDLLLALKYYASGCFDHGKWARRAIAKAEGQQ